MGERRCLAATAALAAAVVGFSMIAGCTSGSGRTAPKTDVTSTAAATVASTSGPSTPVATTTARPTPVKTTPSPALPTIPADVPRTGKNLLTKNEKPPVMPIAATAHTAAGAKAFAAFFVKAIDWGYATTSGSYAHHYYASSCDFCRAYYRDLEYSRTRSHIHIGDRLSIRKIENRTSSVKSVASSSYAFLVRIDATADEVVDKNYKFVTGSPAVVNAGIMIYLRWVQGSWRVAQAVYGVN